MTRNGASSYRSDVEASELTSSLAAIRSVSRVGDYHRLRGEERQDAFGLALAGDETVLAVADGLGSCARSAEGAKAAVDATLSASNIPWSSDTPSRLAAATARILGEPVDPMPFATTLTCARIGSPDPAGCRRVSVLSIGDSPALLLLGASRAWHELAPEASGPGNVVDAYLPGDVDRARSYCVELHPDDCLVLATDGFSAPLLCSEELSAHLADRWSMGPRALVQFIADLTFKGHHDDRTVVAYWNLARHCED